MHFRMAEFGCFASTPLHRGGITCLHIIWTTITVFGQRLTLSRQQSLSHEKLRRTDWPLKRSPSESSCTFCRATAGSSCAREAFSQFLNLSAFLTDTWAERTVYKYLRLFKLVYRTQGHNNYILFKVKKSFRVFYNLFAMFKDDFQHILTHFFFFFTSHVDYCVTLK